MDRQGGSKKEGHRQWVECEPCRLDCLSCVQEQGQRYDTALELLGERNERVDQLEEDIAEMKQIFHEQISMMADQLNRASQTESHALAAFT